MTEIIGVRFRGGPKEYYFDPHGLKVSAGQYVIVDTSQGPEYARCVTGNREVEDSAVVQPLRPLIRVATENDRRTWELNRTREKDAFGICQNKIADHGLDMKLVKVESNFDGSKILFYFTSDGRVDFRALVRDLASQFRARIELRQIGVRDEAKLLGGIGICGRPFCCAEFLDDFIPVSIKMAKTQNLSLNPTKISGTCGRLMCCLKYEQDAYEDAVRRCPRQDSFVLTPDGPGNVTNVDILREQVVVRLDDQPENPRRYHNCELNVLRNGKGSRDGIEIPRERPERYIVPEELDETELRLRAEARELDAMLYDPDSEEGGEKRRRRGGRSRRKGTGQDKPAETAKTENSEKPDKPEKKERRKSDAAPKDAPKTDKPAAAEGEGEKPTQRRRNHRRGGRNHRKGGGGGGAAPKDAE
ncbi:MAG: stage 0 sporulation family protein [Oscillospiraceae bacterium]|nr:stage 0 sporulation family protein [Oscillospiraceae bacterium]